MEKHWNFYDGFGDCVWSTPYHTGDTTLSMLRWWDVWMTDEEYRPDVSTVLLEDFDATNEEEK